jgi:hypothetical protein
MEQVLMTLHRFLLSWLTDDKFREDNPELREAMENHGLADVTGEDVHQAMTLVADELPPYQAQQMGAYLNAPSGAYNTSNFNLNQGGSAGASGTGSQAASHGGANLAAGGSAGSYVLPDHQGHAPIDDAVREIQFITNNFTTINETNTTNIDDRDTTIDNSVRQAINTGGGDLDQDFVSSVVSGDVAGDGNAVGLGNTAYSGDGSAFGIGAAVQSGDGNVAGIGNTSVGNVTGDGSSAAFAVGGDAQSVGGQGNQVGDGSAFGEGAEVANATGLVAQAVTGTGNTTSQFGDANSAGNIVGSEDVNAVGNQSAAGDNALVEGFGNQAAGDDIENNVDFDVDTEDATFQL